MTARRTPLVAAVKRDIAALAKRSPGIEKSSEAALALLLAERLVGDPLAEFPDPLSARVSASRALAEIMATLRATAPAEASDRLDELTARREARRVTA